MSILRSSLKIEPLSYRLHIRPVKSQFKI